MTQTRLEAVGTLSGRIPRRRDDPISALVVATPDQSVSLHDDPVVLARIIVVPDSWTAEMVAAPLTTGRSRCCVDCCVGCCVGCCVRGPHPLSGFGARKTEVRVVAILRHPLAAYDDVVYRVHPSAMTVVTRSVPGLKSGSDRIKVRPYSPPGLAAVA